MLVDEGRRAAALDVIVGGGGQRWHWQRAEAKLWTARVHEHLLGGRQRAGRIRNKIVALEISAASRWRRQPELRHRIFGIELTPEAALVLA